MTARDSSARHAGLDDLSKQIVEQLQQDGRRSYAAIAQAIGLSEAAVRQRVHRLLRSGVIAIVAVTDPAQLGFPRQAMIGIRIDGAIDAVADELDQLPEVDHVVVTAGSFDLLVETNCTDDDHLLELLNGRIRSIPAVRSTETFVYLKRRKSPRNP
jgi:Lrp/AsnC family transcriptional regulator for asnA, asnC and gidA